MNKVEQIQSIMDNAGISKKEATLAFDAMVANVVKTVVAGEVINVTGLGSFKLKKVAGREGTINFGDRKGETYKTEDSLSMKFTVAKAVKDTLNA